MSKIRGQRGELWTLTGRDFATLRGVWRFALLVLVVGCVGGTTPALSPAVMQAAPVSPAVRASAEESPPTVAFVRAGSIWVMTVEGGDQTQVTVRTLDNDDTHPALSPRGGTIAFTTEVNGVPQVAIVRTDDAEPEIITHAPEGADEASWSPDGKTLAYMQGDARDGRALVLRNMRTGDERVLLAAGDDAPEYAGGPAWSPHGKWIALAADRRGHTGTTLWLVDAETGAIKRLTDGPKKSWHLRDQDPSWGPDGKWLTFASNRHVVSPDHAEDFDIYRIALDGSGLIRLTHDVGSATDPSVVPDGSVIVFQSTRSQENTVETELYRMPAGGGKQTRLTRDDHPHNSSPSTGAMK